MKENFVCLITGPMGAGKSSTSKALAEKFEKSAYIKVDHVRKMIMGGYVDPGAEGFTVQENLGTKNTCALANNFLEAGFKVFIDDVIGKEKLQRFVEFFPNHNIKTFLLLPSVEAMLERFHGRGGATEALEKRTRYLHDQFTLLKNEVDWKVIDSSNLILEETVDRIYKELLA
jgi:thymidylate kinase